VNFYRGADDMLGELVRLVEAWMHAFTEDTCLD